jgi:rhodanese-related sulfurtransferase
VWVHCAGGYRAAVAASDLSAANRRLVAIDDTFDNAKLTGLHLITSDTHSAADEHTATDDGGTGAEPGDGSGPDSALQTAGDKS